VCSQTTSNRGPNSPPLAHRVGELVASPETGTPSCFFPLVASPPFALVEGFQAT